MGVNFPDVRYIVDWGPARSILDQHQEAGRAARDEKKSHVIVIYHGQQAGHCEHEVKCFVRAKAVIVLLSIKPWMPQLNLLNLFMNVAHFVQPFASVVVCNVMELLCLLRVPCKSKAAVKTVMSCRGR